MTLSEISYQGSKSRFMKVLKPLIENNLDEGMTYIEPFGGGMNSFTPINASKKIANDINEYNIALWASLKKQGFSGIETEWSDYLNILSNCEDKPNGPNYLRAKKLYFDMKKDCLSDGGKYPKALLGFVAYACSFGGGWWNGFIGYNEKKGKNYIKEAIRGLKKHIDSAVNMENSDFLHGNYESIEIPDNSFVYCDPPYANTKKYANDFDTERFWNWCRELIETKKNIKLLISEYNAPEDFVCIWSKGAQDRMGNNTMSKNEKLFIHNSQVPQFDLSSLSETISISRNDIMEMVIKTTNKILSENLQNELEAFHGTLAKFNQFNHKEFAGSGEGTARYGEGVYLTNVQDTGLHYAATICGQKYGDKIIYLYKKIMNTISYIEGYIKNKKLSKFINFNKTNFEYWKKIFLSVLNGNWEDYPDFWGNKKPFNFPVAKKVAKKIEPEIINIHSWSDFYQWVVDLRQNSVKDYERFLLTVDIPDNGYIRWDNDNPEFIQKLIILMQEFFDKNHSGIKLPRLRKLKTVGDMFDKFKSFGISSYALTKAVEFSGIFGSTPVVGFIVPTGYGRGGDGRGLNYVIFNDKNVKILKRKNLKSDETEYIN